MICIPVAGRDVREVILKAERASELGDLLEIRADFLRDLRGLEDLYSLREIGKPLILTVRSRYEGGMFEGGEEERIDLILELNEILRPDYVDVEVMSNIAPRVVEEVGGAAKILMSYHDFNRTPEREELEEIVRRARSTGGDFVKIATLVERREDAITIVNLLEKGSDVIPVPMGRLGCVLRSILPFLGVPFTYASLEGGEKFAPGQPSAEVLREIWSLLKRC
mgnify:CR=1 FL=1